MRDVVRQLLRCNEACSSSAPRSRCIDRRAEPSTIAPAGLSPPFTQLRAFRDHQSPITGPIRRTMVYSWDDKEAACYKLYVEERMSLEDVMSYWEMRGFTPRYAYCATACMGCRRLGALCWLVLSMTMSLNHFGGTLESILESRTVSQKHPSCCITILTTCLQQEIVPTAV